jgi:transcriptional regulator with XRE-family HTH domain
MEDEGAIARNVRLRMEAKGLGPKALSLKADLNETYVRDILKGKSRNPRQAHLQKLAAALDCRVSDLTDELDPAGVGAVPKQDLRRDLHAAIDAMDEDQRRAVLTIIKMMVPREATDEANSDPSTKPRDVA